MHDALRSAIASRRGTCTWDVDHASLVVTVMYPERQEFSGRCSVWDMFRELGIGQFVV